MTELVDPQPVWIFTPVLLTLFFLLGLGLILAARRRRSTPTTPERTQATARASFWGIGLQGAAFFLASFGPLRLSPTPDTAEIAGAIGVVILCGTTMALFFAASRAMGRNWSVVARTRDDHALVTWGPFARVRNPIYVALFLYLLAMALAFGHWRSLVAGVPLFAIGTWIRVRAEERLLREQFGAAFDAYAARVKRFVPGLF